MVESKPRTLGRPVEVEAKHRLLADTLRGRMLSGEWPEGTTLPSAYALAKEYNVGRRTACMAIDVLKREGRLILNGVRRFIVKKPNGATLTDGMIVELMDQSLNEMMGSWIGDIQRGILLGAGDMRTPILIAHGNGMQACMPVDLLKHPLRGVLVLGLVEDQVLEAYEKLNVPVVLVDRPACEWNLHSVCVDNIEATQTATRHLIALGHRHIAFFGRTFAASKKVEPDTQERQMGYRKALHEAGIPFRSDLIFTGVNSRARRRLSKTGLKSMPQATAVVATDQDLAKEVAEQARHLFGWSVPKDLSIVCFQGTQEASEFSGPRTNFEELGRKAVAIFNTQMNERVVLRIPSIWQDGQTLARPRTDSAHTLLTKARGAS